MTELSPAAKAVLDAFNKGWGPNLPAALRAAAESSVPDDSDGHYVYLPSLLAIADELEAQ